MIPDEILIPIREFFVKNAWIIIILIISICVCYVSVIFLGSDNQVEVAVEKIIETETGIRIDLTP